MAEGTVPAIIVSATDHDLLIRVDTKLDLFIARFDDVNKRLSSVESRVDKAEGGVRGVFAIATFVGAFMGAAASAVFHWFVPLR